MFNHQSKLGFLGRQLELARLREVWATDDSELIFVRGRRRVGKSELLRQLIKTPIALGARAFAFSGRVDESDSLCRQRFARDWDTFTETPALTQLRKEALTWDRILIEVRNHAVTAHRSGLALLFVLDEIQWLAKKHSGVLGAIKEFWELVQAKARLKLMLSGSSNRFFATEVDHADGVLRGLRTKGDLWVQPFRLEEVAAYYFPQWTREQVALVYMLHGGIPYYLQRIDSTKPFLRALNDAAFTADSIFLDEIDAILKVEATGEGALSNVKLVLGALGQDGRTAALIEKITGLSAAHVHSILGRLESYALIKERLPHGQRKKNKAGVRYFMDDFFLNAYFQIWEPLAARIRANHKRGMLINEIVDAKHGYFIRDFTGKAFELLVSQILLAGAYDASCRTAALFTALVLGDSAFEVGTFWIEGKTQIDITVACEVDRQLRVLEVKWQGSAVTSNECSGFIEDVLGKTYLLPDASWSRRDFLILSNGCSQACLEKAKRRNIAILTLEDLFGRLVTADASVF